MRLTVYGSNTPLLGKYNHFSEIRSLCLKKKILVFKMILFFNSNLFFSLDGVQVDGNVTLGENIADHGGLRIAEIAYENWLNQNNGFDASLPALDNFTPFQLFYLGYALPWCAVHSDSMLRHQVCLQFYYFIAILFSLLFVS